MTFEEARRQFPVLERYAYLNAGTNGPLASATVDALVEETRRDLSEGRSGKQYLERMLGLRGEARQGFADLLGVDPVNVALVESTRSRLRDGAREPQSDWRGRGDRRPDQEHFGLTDRRTRRARRRHRQRRRGCDPGAITPRTKPRRDLGRA
jgi:hypothetical protein